MIRTLTAMFDDRVHADAAVQQLMTELSIDRTRVQVHAADASSTAGAASTSQDTGFWASLKDLFVPDEDRATYAEGVRRGSVVVALQAEEDVLDRAMDILESNGAVDLEGRETEWRGAGWTDYGATTGAEAAVASSPSTPELGVVATGVAGNAAPVATTASASMTATTARAGSEEVIPIVEERLTVGKREVDRGRVRVRTYVVETPMQESVTLRDEHVHVERRGVDLPLSAATEDAFRERTIEAVEHDEEAVVSKEARVKEELVIRKDVEQRTETVSDTVRRTEVEIDDDRGVAATTGGTTGARTDKSRSSDS